MRDDVEGVDSADEDATAEMIAKTRSKINDMFTQAGMKATRGFRVFDASPPASLVSALDISKMKIPNVHRDDSPQRTAEHTKTMVEQQADLLELTITSLKLAEQAREDSAAVERFTRRMSWAALAIAIASLAASVAAIFVSAAT